MKTIFGGKKFQSLKKFFQTFSCKVLGQNPPGQNPPGQNPPIISPQTVPLLNTFCFIEMLFSKASFLPPLLDVIYCMVMKWRSVAELSR